MTIRILIFLVFFWVTQIIAQIMLKWGSTSDTRWLWGFLSGNTLSILSLWFLMLIYKNINPNVALGIAIGGSFLLCQVALALVFRVKVLPIQWFGVATIVAGILMFCIGPQLNNNTESQKDSIKNNLKEMSE